MGGSWYWFPSLDDDFRDFIMTQGKHKVAEILIQEIYEGVGDTGIKPGVIGEVGNGDYEGTDIIYHAAAIAQKETGVPVYLCYFDWGTKHVGIKCKFELTDDAKADLKRVQEEFEKMHLVGKHPGMYITH